MELCANPINRMVALYVTKFIITINFIYWIGAEFPLDFKGAFYKYIYSLDVLHSATIRVVNYQ